MIPPCRNSGSLARKSAVLISISNSRSRTRRRRFGVVSDSGSSASHQWMWVPGQWPTIQTKGTSASRTRGNTAVEHGGSQRLNMPGSNSRIVPMWCIFELRPSVRVLPRCAERGAAKYRRRSTTRCQVSRSSEGGGVTVEPRGKLRLRCAKLLGVF